MLSMSFRRRVDTRLQESTNVLRAADEGRYNQWIGEEEEKIDSEDARQHQMPLSFLFDASL